MLILLIILQKYHVQSTISIIYGLYVQKTVVGIHWIYNLDGKEDNQILREKYMMILSNTGKKKDMTFLHIQIQNINEII